MEAKQIISLITIVLVGLAILIYSLEISKNENNYKEPCIRAMHEYRWTEDNESLMSEFITTSSDNSLHLKGFKLIKIDYHSNYIAYTYQHTSKTN